MLHREIPWGLRWNDTGEACDSAPLRLPVPENSASMRAGFLHKLLLVCVSSFLFLLLVIVHQDAPRTLQLGLSAAPRREPVSVEPLQGSPIFQWRGTEEEKARHSMPVPVPSRPPASTRHPLQVVYPYSYRFLLNEPDKCRERAPFLVLLVVSEPKDIEARNAIRQTWGNESAVPGVSMARLFLTGVHPHYSSPLQRLLEEESALHRDIIQQDFLDTYNNLTLKTLMGMEWVSRYCPNASYVVKADSDIFLNVGFLVRELLQPQLPPKKDFMTGYIYRNTGPLRSKAYKWYVPREVYPNDTYPPYCGGPGYVLSGDLAKKVYGVAQTLRVINMEDAFMGICLYELGVSVTDSPWGLFNVVWLEYEKCRFSKLVVVHHFGPTDLLRVWPDFLGGNKTCPS